jgi:predicted nucleotidyltransferase
LEAVVLKYAAMNQRVSSQASLETLVSQIQAHESDFHALGIEKLWIFGSYARGEQRPHSDLDILVCFYPSHRTGAYFNIARVKGVLERECRLSIDVQLEDRSAPHPHVERERIRVF